MQEQRGLIRAAGSMGFVTALSRIAGYVRDNLQASLLGAADASDAFIIAFRIPNLLRRILAEGALTAAFVPTFTRYLKGDDRRAVWRFAGSMLYLLTLGLAAIVVAGILLSPLLVRALAWGFALDPDKLELTVSLSRWMFPYVLCISLAALASGILNACGVFVLPAFTPVLLNLSIIGCAVFLSGRFPSPAYAFALGVLIGGAAQLAVQIPALLRLGFTLRPPRRLDRRGVGEVGRLMLPRVLGVGITQINLVVDSQFASALRAGSVSFLYYAIRITELTLGVFAVSLSTVILPLLSRAAIDGDRRGTLETLTTSVRLLIFVTLPATVGLILLRVPIVHTLFERGMFRREDTLFTAGALALYSLGILPFAVISVLATVFYAERDTRTPVVVGAATFLLHLALNAALVQPLGHRGIALSTSLSALVNAVLLAWLLKRRYRGFPDRRLMMTGLRASGASAIMGAALLAALDRLEFLSLGGTALKAGALLLLVGGGATLYVATSALLRSDEIRIILSAFGGPGGRL